MNTLRSVAVLLLLALAGCDSPAKTPAATAQNDDDQYLAYVKCLQDQGIKASWTRDAQGRGHLEADAGAEEPNFKSAQQACASAAPTGLTKTVSPAELDQLVKVADCMRKQGVDVKVPTADHPGLRISGAEGDTQKTQQIMASCRKQLGL